jgi:TolA-binding protein
MKRAERHHLKENEIERLMRHARDVVDTRSHLLSWVISAVVIVGVLGIGFLVWRERVQTRSQALLADALAAQTARIGPPPAPGTTSSAPYFPTQRERSEATLKKFKAAADAYPSTDSGIFARYQQGAIELGLGRAADAAKSYREVIDRAGSGIYEQMARLGLAEAQASAGQYDQAIDTFKELAQRKDGQLPIDGILMQLGRTYRDAGKRDDAQQTFTRLVDEFPESPFNADAKRELENLKKAAA